MNQAALAAVDGILIVIKDVAVFNQRTFDIVFEEESDLLVRSANTVIVLLQQPGNIEVILRAKVLPVFLSDLLVSSIFISRVDGPEVVSG